MAKKKSTSAPGSLTDRQIRAALEKQIGRTAELRLDLLVLKTALLNKNLLTEFDIAQATEQVSRESKEALSRAAASTHQKPPGGIQ